MRDADARRHDAVKSGTEGDRRGCILGAAFAVLMERGYAGASTLEIATRAKVSKRELYAEFGSKRGILAALIRTRGARIRLPLKLSEARNPAGLAIAMEKFGATLLRELCHPAVMAIFRLAVAEPEMAPEVGKARQANRAAFGEFLAGAQAAGLLGAGDVAAMAERFYALLWGDLQIGLLLRLAEPPTEGEVALRARSAVEAFLMLYGAARRGKRR